MEVSNSGVLLGRSVRAAVWAQQHHFRTTGHRQAAVAPRSAMRASTSIGTQGMNRSLVVQALTAQSLVRCFFASMVLRAVTPELAHELTSINLYAGYEFVD